MTQSFNSRSSPRHAIILTYMVMAANRIALHPFLIMFTFPIRRNGFALLITGQTINAISIPGWSSRHLAVDDHGRRSTIRTSWKRGKGARSGRRRLLIRLRAIMIA
jgi:hypothetical protein